MSIWKSEPPLEELNETSKRTLAEHLDIEFIERGGDYLKARMPVDNRTKQPAGILHGGASAALAETVGSIAAWLCVDHSLKRVVGLEINVNHIRAVRAGMVTAEARPIHVGRSTQVWEIRIQDEAGALTAVSRLTVANIDV